ncbi:hypothetical protein ACOMHN_064486 [Nucella lapillus]
MEAPPTFRALLTWRGRPLALTLFPSGVSAGRLVMTYAGDGDVSRVAEVGPERCHYRGGVGRDPASVAALSTCQGLVRLDH